MKCIPSSTNALESSNCVLQNNSYRDRELLHSELLTYLLEELGE
jgi:hypothetical protein